MRDLSGRIRRYRLSRYARHENPFLRHAGWLGAIFAAWLLWAGVISDHSFLRLWRANRDLTAAKADLAKTRTEIQALEDEDGNPKARAERAERAIRERGMAKPGEIIYREDAPRAEIDSTQAR